MRGVDTQQTTLFSYISPERRVPSNHPLRSIRAMMDELLKEMSPHFSAIYSSMGRPSIPPERLLRALFLQVVYTIRSERQLMEQLDYNLLFRWFVGLNADEPVWHPTVYSHNRDRLLKGRIIEVFFEKVLCMADDNDLVSSEHFTVDGTLIEAWAAMKSFQKKQEEADQKSQTPPEQPTSHQGEGAAEPEQAAHKNAQSGSETPGQEQQAAAEKSKEKGRREGEDPGNPNVDFRGEKRSNQTHESKTDPDARLYRKSKGASAQLCYMGHVVTENRNGLVVNATVTHASGTAEVEAALAMASKIEGQQQATMGADKGYDTEQFVTGLRERKVTPHVAQNTSRRRSNIDGRTTRHAGYAVSQKKRKRVEEVFGWMKTVGLMRKTRHKGVELVGSVFTFTAAAYNLVRMRNLGVTA